ncbi:MAG: CarD family transcriptional regulator [Anaerovoracaceae bacterium]
MYNIGDKIVHPMHGAGTIKKIEKHTILGSLKEYYVLDVSCGGMDVMIPVDNCSNIGVRPVVSEEKISDVIYVLGGESSRMSENWNKRYRENMDKLKTGDINLVAEIVRNLTRTDRMKKLSAGEKKMLTNALKVLQSEIMVVKNISSEEAKNMIEDAITS